MDIVTYPNKAVVDFVNTNVVTVRIELNQRQLADEFKIRYTPTLITLDKDGIERQRTIGFLPPEELIPSLMLAMGKTHLQRGEMAQAIPSFEKVVSEYPKSVFAPEAVFYSGVAQFQSTHDAKFLKKAYDDLTAQYPQSEWTKRASAYSSVE